MNVFIKLAFVCIISAILGIFIKKYNPEISFLISIASLICCAAASIEFIIQLKQEYYAIKDTIYIDLNGIDVLLKCLAISSLTHLSCNICKDAGQGAAAFSLELTGNIVLIICMFPLISSLFQLVENLL